MDIKEDSESLNLNSKKNFLSTDSNKTQNTDESFCKLSLNSAKLMAELASTSQSKPLFKSRFKSWIKTVAFVVVLFFVPEQISWAFNYDPAVLWRDKAPTYFNPQTASPDEISSAQIAASLEHLLKQLADKPASRIELKLQNDRSLVIDSAKPVTSERIQTIGRWLRDPSIHPLNCGVYALKDFLALSQGGTGLATREIEIPLEELSAVSYTHLTLPTILRV